LKPTTWIQTMANNKPTDEIIGKVVAAIARLKEIPPENIDRDSSFEQLKMDSLDGLNLFFELEDAFDLTIPDERARSLRTIHDIVKEIEGLLSDRGAGLHPQS
jgi:acyl carrier protein